MTYQSPWLPMKFNITAPTRGVNPNGTNGQAAPDPSDTKAFPRSISDAFTRYAQAATATGKGTVEDVSKQIETVASDMPILAKRLARLRFAGDSQHWGSLNAGSMTSITASPSFGVDAEAQCAGGWLPYHTFETKVHTAPGLDCTCGFYATPLGGEPYGGGGPTYVTLLVELSGNVIEHELMYRAEHQRVIECQFPRCMYCNREPTVVQVWDGAMHQAACSRKHLTHGKRRKGMILSLDDIRDLLPVPVTILEP